MTGFIIVVVCITGSIIWGITAGRKRRQELQNEQTNENNQPKEQT